MTVGKDVAMLFTDVVNCIQTGEEDKWDTWMTCIPPPFPSVRTQGCFGEEEV